METCVASIDQGTTSTRCIIFNKKGHVVSIDQREHAQIYPKPGWVEHDAAEIWDNTQQVVKNALLKAKSRDVQIAAIGLANQRETTVVWDKKTGKPYGNAIVWQDTRTQALCDALARDEGYDRFRSHVGLPLNTYFAGPKIMWILENVTGVRAAAERGEALFGTMDSWLIWWLTGGPTGGSHVTDVTNASRTMLMNLKTLDWNDEILGIMKIPRAMLPDIVSSSDPQTWGATVKNGPFEEAIPVCGDLGDQQAALVGQACFAPGDVKNTYGTGCFMVLNTGTEPRASQSGMLTTLAYKMGDSPAVYALEGSVAIAGALVQWLRDNLNLFEFSHQIEEMAQAVPDSGGMYVVPAFSGLYAPYWRSDARGVICGLTRYHNKHHIARAALEATAYQTRDVLEAMNKDTGIGISALKVDGGMIGNETLMQFQSDILAIDILKPMITETTAVGAAYAAGLAVGFWENLEALQGNWQLDKVWKPTMKEDIRQDAYKNWIKAVERSFDWC